MPGEDQRFWQRSTAYWSQHDGPAHIPMYNNFEGLHRSYKLRATAQVNIATNDANNSIMIGHNNAILEIQNNWHAAATGQPGTPSEDPLFLSSLSSFFVQPSIPFSPSPRLPAPPPFLPPPSLSLRTAPAYARVPLYAFVCARKISISLRPLSPIPLLSRTHNSPFSL
jgi:hypothetical protein